MRAARRIIELRSAAPIQGAWTGGGEFKDTSSDEAAMVLGTRSLEEAKVTVSLEDAHKQLVDAVHQLTFVLKRLVDERIKDR